MVDESAKSLKSRGSILKRKKQSVLKELEGVSIGFDVLSKGNRSRSEQVEGASDEVSVVTSSIGMGSEEGTRREERSNRRQAAG